MDWKSFIFGAFVGLVGTAILAFNMIVLNTHEGTGPAIGLALMAIGFMLVAVSIFLYFMGYRDHGLSGFYRDKDRDRR